MKVDPYKHKEKFFRWKDKIRNGITDITRSNSDIILQYISDMENGYNISSKNTKGPRSYIRLNNLRQRMTFLAKQIEQRYHTNLVDAKEEELIQLFSQMRNGTIRRIDGERYKSVIDFIKPFKSFWHWYMKVSKKKGIELADITEDIDVSVPKPKWVYLSQDQVKQLCDHAKPEYKVLIAFLYDSGIRSPTELVNIQVSDLCDDFKQLNIRQEIAKGGSLGRRIKLMLCSDLLRQYVKDKNLKENAFLFVISPQVVNQYFKRLATRVLGKQESLAGELYSNLTMYDFRHCSCCYWLPRYKSESALKYRFGWKKSDRIHYYSELLGMKDTITEEDLLVDLTKSEIEKKLLASEHENEILKDRMQALEKQMNILVKTIQEVIPKTQITSIA